MCQVNMCSQCVFALQGQSKGAFQEESVERYVNAQSCTKHYGATLQCQVSTTVEVQEKVRSFTEIKVLGLPECYRCNI